jgi:hypothetical protein
MSTATTIRKTSIEMALLSINRLNQLPSRGRNVGDVYHVNADKSTWLVVNDFSLLNLTDLLSGAGVARAVGPQGEAGVPGRDGIGINGNNGRDGKDSNVPGPRGETGQPGQTIIGPKGERGEPGRAGRDGKDSNVPGARGEKGDSIIGPQGPRGDVLIPNDSELAAAVIALRQKLATVQAAFLQGMMDAGNIKHAGVRSLVTNKLEIVKRDAGL